MCYGSENRANESSSRVLGSHTLLLPDTLSPALNPYPGHRACEFSREAEAHWPYHFHSFSYS